MKCGELVDVLERIEAFYRFGGFDVPRAVTNFKKLMAAAPEATVVQFSKKLGTLPINVPSEGAIDVTEILDFAETLESFLARAAKPAILKDLTQIVTALKRHKFLDANILAAPTTPPKPSAKGPAHEAARADVVQAHLRKLEQSLGDDAGFTTAFHALNADPEIRTAEYVALAKLFAFAAVKSKASALKKIRARHETLMTSRAKMVATAGRIAG
jgi:hypothetical protein